MLAVPAAGVWMYFAYQLDLRASRERLRGASHVIETRCGPIVFTEAGGAALLLIVHGAGGGSIKEWTSASHSWENSRFSMS